MDDPLDLWHSYCLLFWEKRKPFLHLHNKIDEVAPIIYIDEKQGFDKIIVAINYEFQDRNQIKNR